MVFSAAAHSRSHKLKAGGSVKSELLCSVYLGDEIPGIREFSLSPNLQTWSSEQLLWT